MKEWNDEAEYLKRYPSKEDRPEDEVQGGYYAEGLPKETHFVWHILKVRDGRFRVVIDFFLPWDAVDMTWEYLWRSKDKAVLWARAAVRVLAAVEEHYFETHGVEPGVIEAVERAMEMGAHDVKKYRPGPEDRIPVYKMNGPGGRRIRER